MLLPKRFKKKAIGGALACSLLLVSCSPKQTVTNTLIPKPAYMELTGGYLQVDDSLQIPQGQSGSITYQVNTSLAEDNPEKY